MRRIISLVLALFIFSPEMAAADETKKMVERWDNCFYASTASQFVAKFDAEPNMVAEIAFQACVTEEKSLGSLLALHGVEPAFSSAVLLKHRSILKRRIVGQ